LNANAIALLHWPVLLVVSGTDFNTNYDSDCYHHHREISDYQYYLLHSAGELETAAAAILPGHPSIVKRLAMLKSALPPKYQEEVAQDVIATLPAAAQDICIGQIDRNNYLRKDYENKCAELTAIQDAIHNKDGAAAFTILCDLLDSDEFQLRMPRMAKTCCRHCSQTTTQEAVFTCCKCNAERCDLCMVSTSKSSYENCECQKNEKK